MQEEQEITPKELKKQVKILTRENKVFEKKLLASQEKFHAAEERRLTLEERNKFLEFQLAQMRRMLYGAKRERFISNATVGQLTLPFEVIETVPEQSTKKQQVTYTREVKKSKHPGRLDFPAHIPVEEIVIEPEQDTQGLVCIGQEVTKELDYIPAKLFARHFIRNKYALPNGEGIIIGKLPIRPIEKGIDDV